MHNLLRGILLMVGLALHAEADSILLRPATTLLASGAILDIGDYAIPCVADWNADGKKDLLVGYRYADKVALFLNSGSDDSPVFTTFMNLQCGNPGGPQDIVVPGSSCGAPAPWVCDYDNDGELDLLVGSGADGSVKLFRNTGTSTAPQLAPEVTVVSTTAGVGSRATPYVHDWDQDGLKDLLSGDPNGYVWLFRNTNTAETPIYEPKQKIQAGGVDLSLGSRSIVRLWDWDNDGLKDLVGSSATGVYWCRNKNSNSAPVFEPKVALQTPVPSGGLANINISTRMRLDLTDWNNDGVVDLILGVVSGEVVLYSGYRFALSTPICSQTDQTVILRWNTARYLSYTILGGTDPTNISTPLATNVAGGDLFSTWTNQLRNSLEFYRVCTP